MFKKKRKLELMKVDDDCLSFFKSDFLVVGKINELYADGIYVINFENKKILVDVKIDSKGNKIFIMGENIKITEIENYIYGLVLSEIKNIDIFIGNKEIDECYKILNNLLDRIGFMN